MGEGELVYPDTLQSTSVVVVGCLVFALTWGLVVTDKFPLLPVGRTAGTLVGATLMIVGKVLTPNQGFAAIDWNTLALLWGTMVITEVLQRTSILSAVMAALVTNDTTCVVLTPVVVDGCRRRRLPIQPYLVALASAANLGSALTPIGNPQNMIIANMGGISFLVFLKHLTLAVVVTLALSTCMLLGLYWRRLAHDPDSKDPPPRTLWWLKCCMPSSEFRPEQQRADAENQVSINVPTSRVDDVRQPPLLNVGSQTTEPLIAQRDMSILSSQNMETGSKEANMTPTSEPGSQQDTPPTSVSIPHPTSTHEDEFQPCNCCLLGRLPLTQRRREELWHVAVYLIFIGVLALFIGGLSMAWVAVGGAILLLCIEWRDANPQLEKVQYTILVFFSGLFISVAGFNMTGVPGVLWSAVESYCGIGSVGGTVLLCVIILVLSNVASNVPTVLLLGPRIAAAATAQGQSATAAWLLLAFVSTVAGNVCMMGSVANLIVSERARRWYRLSFWNHLRFGLVSTLVVCVVGVPLIAITNP